MASDGIKEPVHHTHLTTNIYLSCQDNDVSKLVDVVDGNGKDGTVKDDPPQHRLAACTCLQQGSTCLCAGRNSPRCAGRRNLINRHSHSHLYVIVASQTVSSTESIELVVKDGHPCRASLGAHWRHMAPLPSCRVKPEHTPLSSLTSFSW